MTNHRARSKKKAMLHKFYFLRPRPNIDADQLAEKLMSLKPVEEVFLTDGDYGFIVKAKFFENEEPKDVSGYIQKNIDNRFGKVVSYVQYSK